MGSALQKIISKRGIDRSIMAAACAVFAAFALFAPIWPGNSIEPHLGGLLLWIGILEIYDAFRRSDPESKKMARRSGILSLIIAIILINAELFQDNALFIFILILFIIDALRYLLKFIREYRAKRKFLYHLLVFAGYLLLVIFLLAYEEKAHGWVLSIAIAFRMVGVGLSLLTATSGELNQAGEDVVSSMGLSGDPYISNLAKKIQEEEEIRAPYDRSWIITFLFLLFFIHLGRMGFDRSFIGVLSPLVAVIGDIVIALAISYIFIGPLRYGILKSFGRLERRAWKWNDLSDNKSNKKTIGRRLVNVWLSGRMRSEIRFKKIGYSLPTAIRTGLRVGLPWSALLAAIIPVFGMSWYFDTENWASGVWDRWAATRTDVWRMAITETMGEGFGANAFKLHPAGVNNNGDFSFVIIGDPGEGDASQLILKDQLIAVSNHPEVKFVVISTDVVYPSGALSDYEKKFWLPFNGVRKPVYAIPGNHDYYDALDAFIATFYEPDAAKKAMTARVNKDLHISSTTEGKIDDIISKSATWRKEYEVPTGLQKSPYFQISTDDFVFITIETGVERQIDSLQRKWLVNILEASKGKFVFALLGHPFYAAGEYMGNKNPDFESIHTLLKKYKVPIAMAGDTHDLEYYKEPSGNGDNYIMHNFVNGGGGAYLSIGAVMTDTSKMPTKDYAFYPSHDPMVKKIRENTAWYKEPAWWWTNKLNGWPFSAEWLSAMFDYNVSPFFQSLIEVKVMPSKKQIVLIPYSNHGRLKWNDVTSTKGARPAGAGMDDFIEWTFPMP